MKNRKAIINPGLARCGTTATDHMFQRLAGFATPNEIKELKYFLKPNELKDYISCFSPKDNDILFESSPPYMHSGLVNFERSLKRIAALRDIGYDVHIFVNTRNLVERAFSHYWHDIRSQYAKFGSLWSVREMSHPRRLKNLYSRSFLNELNRPDGIEKFLPKVGVMLHLIIDTIGSEKLRIVSAQNLNHGLDLYIKELTGNRSETPIETPRVAGAGAPVYLYGGAEGRTFTLPSGEVLEKVYIPKNKCVLFDYRHQELLSGEDYDLKAIVSASKMWSYSVDARELPDSLNSYLLEQKVLLSKIPESCFIVGDKAEILERSTSIPSGLKIKSAKPTAGRVRQLLEGKGS